MHNWQRLQVEPGLQEFFILYCKIHMCPCVIPSGLKSGMWNLMKKVVVDFKFSLEVVCPNILTVN